MELLNITIITILLVITTVVNANNNGAVNKKIPSSHGNYIHKCCPMGKYVGQRKTCVDYNVTLTISGIEVYDKDISKTGKSIEDVFRVLPGKFEDEEFKETAFDLLLLKFNLYLIENAVLQVEMPNTYQRWTPVLRANFCVDYRIMKNKSIKPSLHFWAILPDTETYADSNDYLTGAMLVSCFFMLLVLIVYFLLPEYQNLCGMILMAYVGSLFMAFLLLAIIQMQQHTAEACIGLTMGIYFFFLASFCWMSVMSYDIWWTFRGYAKARPIHRRGERFKFLMYCLYAWGLPLCMTIAVAVLNVVDMSDLPWFVTPHVPDQGCFLEGGIKLLYLYIPMLILILLNWMFYLMTAFNIWRISRETAVLDSAAAGNPQAHRTHKHRFMVYLKLSVVMGLNWLLEVVSFLYPGFKIWYITDAYNILIGLAIFLIFVCKKKTFRKLCKRYGGKTTMRWYPSSKSYTSSTSDSNNETSTLQSKVSSNPKGMNGYAMSPNKNRFE